jgi:Oxidoreductase molybdopterin binding domain
MLHGRRDDQAGEDYPSARHGFPAARRRSVVSFIECAGNGRSFFTTQQDQTLPGTPWLLGAIGVAKWRGVRLSTVLERAGLTRAAVDVMPYGLDPDFVTGGVDYGPVRRPIPVRKALDDVILAYEMNGHPLPPDSGFPSPVHRSLLGRYLQHQVGRPDRGLRRPAGLLLEHAGLPAVWPELPGRRHADHETGGEKRLRAGMECAAESGPAHPAHWPFLVR